MKFLIAIDYFIKWFIGPRDIDHVSALLYELPVPTPKHNLRYARLYYAAKNILEREYESTQVCVHIDDLIEALKYLKKT